MIKIVKKKFYYFWSMKFVRDVFTLQVGSFFGTGIALVTSIIFARVLGAETYGNYALIFAFTSLVGILMDWGVGYATLTILSESYVRGDKEEMKNVITYFFKLSLIIAVTIGLLSIVLAPLFTSYIYQQSQIGNLARLIIIASIIRTFLSFLIIMLQVLRKIKYLTLIENINKLFLSFFPIIFLLLGFGLWGIVWGHFLATFIFMIFSIWIYYNFARRNKYVPQLKEIFSNFSKVKISKYFGFGFTVSLDKKISNLYVILPIIILGALATPEQVANIKIAIAYLALPKIFLGPIGRLLQVQLPKAKIAGAKDLKSNFYKSSLYAGFAFLMLTIIFILFSPFAIKVLYGSSFALSARLVYPLSLSVMFTGFMVGLSAVYRTVNKMKSSIIVNSINLFLGLVVLAVSLKFTTPLQSVVVLIVYWALSSLVIHLFVVRKIFKEFDVKKI